MTTKAGEEWVCTKCSKVFGRHDQWFEGDVCDTCADVKEYRMVVACTNSEGDPDLAFVKVQSSTEDIEDGTDIDKVREWADKQGYEGPYVVFNCEQDSAGMTLVDLFTWESASTI